MRKRSLVSHQNTLLPSANLSISLFTTSLRRRAESAASTPRGNIEQRTIFASGCFSMMTRSISRTPSIVSAGGSFSNGKWPELFVPIIRTTHFAL